MPTNQVLRLTIYESRANALRLHMIDYDPLTGERVDMDWSNVHHMYVSLIDHAKQLAYGFDSQVYLPVVNFATNGILEFQFDGLGIEPGTYYLRVTLFDLAGRKIELIHESMPGERLVIDALETTPSI